jgi:hypothetical protein
MKKIIILGMVLAFLCYCVSKKDNVEKTVEDGVEVVLNHLEPYQVKGESGILRLEREFSIDTENEAVFKLGLTDIETFDVDAEGNIYIIQWQSKENYVFKFDSAGNFIKSFMRFGQGPGEIEWGGTVLINPQGEVIAKDPSKRKFLVYDRDGNFLRETHLKEHYSLLPLENGKYFIFWQENAPELVNIINHFGICNSEFEDIRELDTLEFPNLLNPSSGKSCVNRNRMISGASHDRIYIGNSERGYEIHVYDLDGNLLRKIRKEYKPVFVSEEFKKAYFERFPEGDPWRDKFYFTERWLPFRDLFTDDEGRLFVLTCEDGLNPGEYMYDIFNSEGVFVGRTSFMNSGFLQRSGFPVRAKKNHLYCIGEKESGYKELVVYKMNWE